MPRIPRIVPWSSYQELEDVYNMLYFDGPEAEFQRDLGVQRVSSNSLNSFFGMHTVFQPIHIT